MIRPEVITEDGLLNDHNLAPDVPYTLYCLPDRVLVWADDTEVMEYDVVVGGSMPVVRSDRLNVKSLRPGVQYTVVSSGAPSYQFSVERIEEEGEKTWPRRKT